MTTGAIIINEYPLMVKEYQNKRLVTFKDIDKIHKRPIGTARKRFNDNQKRFIEGTDYYKIKSSQKSDFRTLEIPNRGLTLFTETGYLMLVKTFTDDIAWQVQRELVNTYFQNKQEIQTQYQIPTEMLSVFNKIANRLNCIDEMKSDIERIKSLVITMLPPLKRTTWKFEVGSKIKSIAQSLDINSNNTKSIYSDIYNIMRDDYDKNINPYTAQYLLEHPEVNHVPVIDVVENNIDLKELFETILNNYLEIKSVNKLN